MGRRVNKQGLIAVRQYWFRKWKLNCVALRLSAAVGPREVRCHGRLEIQSIFREEQVSAAARLMGQAWAGKVGQSPKQE